MHIPDKIDIPKIVDYLTTVGEDSTVYIGCDSEKFRINDEWWADYSLVVVIHKDNKHGGKVFGAITRERVYDQKPSKPAFRLMREVHLVAELYLQLADVIYNPIEVHLDINPNFNHGSSCIVHEAIGYVKGVCQVEPAVKPSSWAASFAADQLKRIMNYKIEAEVSV
jgi:hypothetical protein